SVGVHITHLGRRNSSSLQSSINSTLHSYRIWRHGTWMVGIVGVSITTNFSVDGFALDVFFSLQNKICRTFAQVQTFSVCIKRTGDLIRENLQRIEAVYG